MSATQFNHDEYLFAYPDGIENNFWNYARNKTIHHWLKTIPHRKILDIGCGRGVVTDFLYRHSINITGVELGTTTPISSSGANILYGTNALQLDEATRTQFNTITLFDVLEHLENPVQFVKDLRAHFPSAEYLLLTVPARQELWSNFDEYYGHMQRYTPRLLKDELEQAGCTVIRQRYFFHSLYFVMKLNKMMKRERKIAFHAPGKGLTGLVHKFIGTFFYLESRSMPKKLKGSSIICIAKL